MWSRIQVSLSRLSLMAGVRGRVRGRRCASRSSSLRVPRAGVALPPETIGRQLVLGGADRARETLTSSERAGASENNLKISLFKIPHRAAPAVWSQSAGAARQIVSPPPSGVAEMTARPARQVAAARAAGQKSARAVSSRPEQVSASQRRPSIRRHHPAADKRRPVATPRRANKGEAAHEFRLASSSSSSSSGHFQFARKFPPPASPSLLLVIGLELLFNPIDLMSAASAQLEIIIFH